MLLSPVATRDVKGFRFSKRPNVMSTNETMHIYRVQFVTKYLVRRKLLEAITKRSKLSLELLLT